MGDKTYILHDQPALMSAQQYIANADLAPFGLPGEYEQLWLGDLGDGTYELRCIPFRVYGLSLLDRVNIADDLVTGVAGTAGHRTLRALIVAEPNGTTIDEIRAEFIQVARDEDLLLEWSGNRHVAIDVPPGKRPAPLSNVILRQQQAQNLAWEWSDKQPFVAG